MLIGPNAFAFVSHDVYMRILRDLLHAILSSHSVFMPLSPSDNYWWIAAVTAPLNKFNVNIRVIYSILLFIAVSVSFCMHTRMYCGQFSQWKTDMRVWLSHTSWNTRLLNIPKWKPITDSISCKTVSQHILWMKVQTDYRVVIFSSFKKEKEKKEERTKNRNLV